GLPQNMREATLPASAAVLINPASMAPAGEAKPARAAAWREALTVGLVLTAWSLIDRGYAGGRWWDVPAIKSFADPRLYRQDPFVWSLHDGSPAAYAYELMAAVVRALPWVSTDQALLAIYLPATLAALVLLYLIVSRLSGDCG